MTTATALESWITCRKPSPQARLRVFCFPYAGGGVSIFPAWSDGLPADVRSVRFNFLDGELG
jgi:medium-chain acyl-[acyl-carrier-protein] hydrolase